MICTQCNREIPDGSTVCPYCGSAISMTPPVVSALQTASANSPFKKAGDLTSPTAPSVSMPSNPQKAAPMSIHTVERPMEPDRSMPAPTAVATGKFCSKCGSKLNGVVKFCPSCGAKVGAAVGGSYEDISSSSRNPARAYSPITSSTPVSPTAARPARGAVEALREICVSPLSLIVIVLHSLGILLAIFSAVNTSNSLLNMVSQYASMLDVGEYIDTLRDIASGASAATAIISNIPTILIAIGLWMFYVSAKSGTMKTSGLTMIKVITLIGFIGFCLLIGVVEIGALVMAIRFGQMDSSAVTPFIITMIAAALIAFPSGFFIFQELRTIDTIKSIVLTGKPSDRLSRYVAVILFIGAGVQIISSLISAFAGGGFLLLLSGLCSGSVSILFGVIIFTLRSKMQELMM